MPSTDSQLLPVEGHEPDEDADANGQVATLGPNASTSEVAGPLPFAQARRVQAEPDQALTRYDSPTLLPAKPQHHPPLPGQPSTPLCFYILRRLEVELATPRRSCAGVATGTISKSTRSTQNATHCWRSPTSSVSISGSSG